MADLEFHVFHGEQKVGDLFETEIGSIGFQYSIDWLNAVEESFAISHSLPLKEGVYFREAQNYFANLLPEGEVRLAVASQHGISSENDFRLLIALGGECAGALTIGREPLPLKSDYVPIDLNELRRRVEQGETLLSSYQDESREVRLSLAGAQDKLPIYLDRGRIALPRGNSPSTHLLKLPSRRFKHLPDNELLMSRLASEMGLETARTEIFDISGLKGCLVERYDRVRSASSVRRLHQEDFCQATGVSYKAKYEKDKGPRFEDCSTCVETNSQRMPEDLERLVTWLVFNVLIGNCDAHAKNLSLLMKEKGAWELSPHYDLVSTKVYPRVSTGLAMSIGGAFDSGTVTGTHWTRLASQIKFGSGLLRKIVKEMSEEASDRFCDVSAEFEKQHGRSEIVEPLRKVVHEQSRRLISQLKK